MAQQRTKGNSDNIHPHIYPTKMHFIAITIKNNQPDNPTSHNSLTTTIILHYDKTGQKWPKAGN